MTMRDETRQKLERTLRMQRLRAIALAAAAVVAIAGLIVLSFSRNTGPDVLVEERTVPAVVKFWLQAPVRQAQGQGVISVTATLDSGRDVQAGSSAHHTAKAGDRIELTERRYKSGRTTYVWK